MTVRLFSKSEFSLEHCARTDTIFACSHIVVRMPTISVDKYELYKELGQQFTTKEFEELSVSMWIMDLMTILTYFRCFDFGIELDEDTENDERPLDKNGKQEPAQLKIGGIWLWLDEYSRD